MFDEVLVCLDGSSLAESILPLARAITAPTGGKLTLLRIVRDPAELSAEEDYLRDCARQYSAGLRFVVSTDPASAIGAELERTPRSIAALTTHGRTAWVEGILGSVALRVLRESKQPVILFRPLGERSKPPEKISTVAVALDATEFSEQIVPYAVRAARSLSARLLLIQALPVYPPILPGPDQETVVMLESCYLHRQAANIRAAHGIEPQWEVLHGNPSDAICRYLKGMPDTLLAMTTHARSTVQRALLGSVAGYCVRHAGVPLLLYWPHSIIFNKLGSE
jgi:nucleotide-binding universal stress UspA family protein